MHPSKRSRTPSPVTTATHSTNAAGEGIPRAPIIRGERSVGAQEHGKSIGSRSGIAGTARQDEESEGGDGVHLNAAPAGDNFSNDSRSGAPGDAFLGSYKEGERNGGADVGREEASRPVHAAVARLQRELAAERSYVPKVCVCVVWCLVSSSLQGCVCWCMRVCVWVGGWVGGWVGACVCVCVYADVCMLVYPSCLPCPAPAPGFSTQRARAPTHTGAHTQACRTGWILAPAWTALLLRPRPTHTRSPLHTRARSYAHTYTNSFTHSHSYVHTLKHTRREPPRAHRSGLLLPWRSRTLSKTSRSPPAR